MIENTIEYTINILNALTSIYVPLYIFGRKLPDLVFFNVVRLMIVYTYYYPICMCLLYIFIQYDKKFSIVKEN